MDERKSLRCSSPVTLRVRAETTNKGDEEEDGIMVMVEDFLSL